MYTRRVFSIAVITMFIIGAIIPVASLNTCQIQNKLTPIRIGINVTERYVMFLANITILSISDYSYLLILFAGDGVFAYGYYIEKRPESTPLLYRVSGDQNSWFLVSPITVGESIVLSTIIDTANKTLYQRVNNIVYKSYINETLTIKSFTIIIDSLSEEQEPPCIGYSVLAVAESNNLTRETIYNTTLQQFTALVISSNIIFLKKALEQTTASQPATPETTTPALPSGSETTGTQTITSYEESPANWPSTILVTIVLGVIVLAIALLLLYRAYWKRSHGP